MGSIDVDGNACTVTVRSDVSRSICWYHVQQSDIDSEQQQYHDILQFGHFIDSYYNLAIKTVSAVQWIDTANVQYGWLYKTDDDVFVNTLSVSNYLREVKMHADLDKTTNCMFTL